MGLTWRRRLNGWQAVKLGSLRNDLKKLGQFVLVKLLPRLVSKGSGSGVLEGASAVVIAGVEVLVEDELGLIIVDPVGEDDGGPMVVASVGFLADDDVLNVLESSVWVAVAACEDAETGSISNGACRRWTCRRGCGLISIKISPRRANSANWARLAAWFRERIAASAGMHRMLRTRSVDSRMLDKDVVAVHAAKVDAGRACWLCWRRRRPGRGLLLCDRVLCSLRKNPAASLFDICSLLCESSLSNKLGDPRTSGNEHFSCESIANWLSEEQLASPTPHLLVGCCGESRFDPVAETSDACVT